MIFSSVERTDHLRDVDKTERADGLVPTWDEAGQTHRYRQGGGFDPDDPLDYFTMVDTDGDVWLIEIGTDGTLTTSADTALTTESGDVLTTEAGDGLATE